jgi:hypothetical protein
VHGIGGAAYDRLTDDLVERLTGCQPPRYAVVSGTLRLPMERVFPGLSATDPAGELAGIHRELRDLEFHPERYLPPAPAIDDIVIRKRRWIETHPTATLARRRCHEIRAANVALATHTIPLRDALLARVGPLAARQRARRLLLSREYPWCFFPENELRRFLLLEKG